MLKASPLKNSRMSDSTERPKGMIYTSQKIQRDSGVELLKLFAMFLIVFYHVLQTLSSSNSYISYSDYIFKFSSATTDGQRLLMAVLYCCTFGNLIFIITSFWHLVDNDNTKKGKIFRMLGEIWFISVLILIFCLMVYNGSIDTTLIKNSLFPTTFANNWFMTVYMLFYLAHGKLNVILRSMNQKTHLRCVLFFGFLYMGVGFIYSGLYYGNDIVLWIALYFLVAYVKKYAGEGLKNTRACVFMVIAGIVITALFVLVTNYLDLHFGLKTSLIKWKYVYNPFLIMTVFGLMGLAQKLTLKSRVINYLSGLTMLVYIIHENILFRIYYRPKAINYLYQHFGYDHVLLLMLGLTAMIFVWAFACAFVYKISLQKVVYKGCDAVYGRLRAVYYAAENRLLNQKGTESGQHE